MPRLLRSTFQKINCTQVEEQLRNTLPKRERLCGRSGISRLLAEGRHGSVPGLRYLCLVRKEDTASASRIMISVPKKLFKRAVKRNLLKRRIRESWRRQKHDLHIEGSADILFMYSAKDILDYGQICSAVGQIIEILNRKYGKQPEE